jgi:hypothetical protein
MKGASYVIMARMVAPPGGRIKNEKREKFVKNCTKNTEVLISKLPYETGGNSKTYTRTYGTSIFTDPLVSLPDETGSGKFNMATT